MPIALSSQRKSFNIVISDLSLCTYKSIGESLNYLSSYGLTYYACVHDKDKDLQNNLKRTHLHIVITSLKLLRVKQVISMLCNIFDCLEQNVQIIECLNLFGAVQYLTHKNNEEKHLYSIRDIYTNDTHDNFMRIYSEVLHKDTLTTDYLIALCTDPNYNRIDIIRAIGIANYNAYRNTINDLRVFYGGDINDEHENFMRRHNK